MIAATWFAASAQAEPDLAVLSLKLPAQIAGPSQGLVGIAIGSWRSEAAFSFPPFAADPLSSQS